MGGGGNRAPFFPPLEKKKFLEKFFFCLGKTGEARKNLKGGNFEKFS